MNAGGRGHDSGVRAKGRAAARNDHARRDQQSTTTLNSRLQRSTASTGVRISCSRPRDLTPLAVARSGFQRRRYNACLSARPTGRSTAIAPLQNDRKNRFLVTARISPNSIGAEIERAGLGSSDTATDRWPAPVGQHPTCVSAGPGCARSTRSQSAPSTGRPTGPRQRSAVQTPKVQVRLPQQSANASPHRRNKPIRRETTKPLKGRLRCTPIPQARRVSKSPSKHLAPCAWLQPASCVWSWVGDHCECDVVRYAPSALGCQLPNNARYSGASATNFRACLRSRHDRSGTTPDPRPPFTTCKSWLTISTRSHIAAHSFDLGVKTRQSLLIQALRRFGPE